MSTLSYHFPEFAIGAVTVRVKVRSGRYRSVDFTD